MDISFHGISPGKAQLKINLRSHINAYHRQNINKADFNQSHRTIKGMMDEGPYLFKEFVETAINEFSESEKSTILKSPAYLFMSRQFAESLKNTIDSVLAMHLDDPQHIDSLAILDISIENNSKENEVTITLSDNGMGFPETLLDRIETKEKREANDYYHSAVGKSNKIQQPNLADHKTLFIGGAGRGLAELICLADKSDPKFGQEKGKGQNLDIGIKMEGLAESTTYEIPEKSELILSNKDKTIDEHGAIISLTTSATPIHAIVKTNTSVDMHEQPLVLPTIAERRRQTALSKQTLQSPVTVTQVDSLSPNPTSAIRRQIRMFRDGDDSQEKENIQSTNTRFDKP